MLLPQLIPADAEFWSAIWVTLKLAACTTIALIVIALPLCHWLNHSRRLIARLVDVLISLPIILPPTVIGYYLLAFMAPRQWAGKLWNDLFGAPLPFSFAGLVAGSVIYSLPFAVQPIQNAFLSVDIALIESASALGASGWRTFWRVILPSARGGVATGAALSFAHTIGEFGVVLMLGGNIPGRTRVASIALYDEVQKLNYTTANQYAIVLVLISLALLTVIGVLRRHQSSGLPQLG